MKQLVTGGIPDYHHCTAVRTIRIKNLGTRYTSTILWRFNILYGKLRCEKVEYDLLNVECRGISIETTAMLSPVF